MARRRNVNSTDSFELLLDTITNTFGGILFLAILVVILIRSTTEVEKVEQETPRTDLQILAEKLNELQLSRSELQSQIDARELGKKLNDPELIELVSDLEARRGQRDQLATERAELLAAISSMQTTTNEIVAEMAEFKGKLEQATKAQKTATSELDEQKSKRRVSSPFPREESSSKREISLTLRYNRIYEKRKRDASGDFGKPNTDDFFVLGVEGTYLALTPKPYRGTPVLDGDKLGASANTLLSTIDPASSHVSVAIWDESFEAFQALREYFVERGIRYRLLVMTDGEAVVEGYVPNPKVQ